MFCWTVNLNLAWTYYFTGILIASSVRANIYPASHVTKHYCQVVPIAMSITWARATAAGVISGVLGGCGAGMATWLSLAATYPGGLSAGTFVR